MSTILVLIVALAHIYFFYLESIAWTKPLGLKIFAQSLEEAQRSAVLAGNQGFYNLCLALTLLATFMLGDYEARLIRIFAMSYIVAVGFYGAATVTKKIFFLQALPAILALIFII
jgi:putative membrane protein